MFLTNKKKCPCATLCRAGALCRTDRESSKKRKKKKK